MFRRILILILILFSFSCSSGPSNNAKTDSPEMPAATSKAQKEGMDHAASADKKPSANEKFAVFAGGCFWCTEKDFESLSGVRDAVSGYTGGDEENPTYTQVGRGLTGHTEAIKVYYDPDQISYSALVEKLWRSCDPTDNDGQFVDRGHHYRPGIFYASDAEKEIAEKSKAALQDSGRFSKPIVLKIEGLKTFWPAETYHQDFYKKSPDRYYSYRKGSGRDAFIASHWKE